MTAARVTVTGDLGQLTRKMEKFGSDANRLDMSRLLGQAAITRIGLEFKSSTDPYGKTWKPLKSRAGQPLRDTGRLEGSFHYNAFTRGFQVSEGVVYAAVHQYGATIRPKTGKVLAFKPRGAKRTIFAKQVTIPQRQMVPEGDLGPIWAKDFDSEISDFIEKYFGA